MSVASKNARQIFLDAIKLASDQRESYLVEACAGDEPLRLRVADLLKSHEEIGRFLEAPPAVTDAIEAPGSPPQFSEGTQIGPYKLLQQIGEGGMGVVYMAEQQKPVRRRIALKIIKPGMDSRQVIARFEAERQALAMMDHPNIARVLDASCTDSGRPYFVMELIQGIPITQYCDDKQLNTSERLELFIQVCQAVQHAHQKGIIHRDIKPSNVLVMIYDGKPIPKIIDFGVAKALHQQLTEKTLFTQFGAVVGTLEYMSPEQAEMDVLGTDTRTDVYSLGVLLYELLTGSTPLDGKKLRALGYAEMLKTIREVDPPKPSTRLSQSAHDVASISANRHTEPRRLQKLIAGDLDWIVMKCLEKDRARRYETANGLALDIQRHLQDEAVTACPPGQFYKLQKLVRRNKLACTAAACVMLALVIGLVASLWQAGRAEHEAARAQNEAMRAQQEADRASEALKDLQAAAPSIAAEARALAAQEKFDEAIGKLEYAAKLRPDVPEYLKAKADLLETQLRLADAAAAYRAELKLKPDDARAQANAELCEQLVAAPKSPEGKLTREGLSRLNAQMTKELRPAAEIMPVARLLGDEKKYIVNYWLDRLKDLPNGTDMPLDKRLTVREDGLLDLNLGETQIADLAPLAGMPLGTLNIPNCKKVTDLSPLRGMSLTKMSVDGTGVTSLEPLRGMSSLQKLIVSGTPVSDLSPLSGLRLNWIAINECPVTSLAPLRGMPLEQLVMRNTAVTDLSPLAGMPLKYLDVTGDGVTDFTPLKGLPLEVLYLQGVRVGDLAFLKGAPLKQLTLFDAFDARNLAVLSEIRTLEVLALPGQWNFAELSVEDFTAVEKLRDHPSLKQLAATIPIHVELANLPSKDEFWKNWDRDYAWALRLRKAGFAFSSGRMGDGTWWLSFANKSPISDLSILAGAPISQLVAEGAKVSDLTPLKSMPLTSLDLNGDSAMADLGPLRGMKLDEIRLMWTQVSDLSPLKGMPLRLLDLRKCDQLTALAPLAEIPAIKTVLLPLRARDVESLRKLPDLKEISFSWSPNVPTCTAEEFWKTWDGLPWARKLEAAGIHFDLEQLPDGYYDVRVHDPKFTDCSIFTGSNVRRLDLDKSGVTDLSPLADLPLTGLSLRETPVTDLSPLRGMPLTYLSFAFTGVSSLEPLRGMNSLRTLLLWNTNVTDLSPLQGLRLNSLNVSACRVSNIVPLRGMPLESLHIPWTVVSDLSPLAGMPLKSLDLSGIPAQDFSPLAGMPLTDLAIAGTRVTDLSPLLKCPTLKLIVLPQGAKDVESLHGLPNLERVSYTSPGNGYPDKTADEFWAANKNESWARKLEVARIAFAFGQLPGGYYYVTVHDPKFADCSIFKWSNVRRLDLDKSRVADLSPLADLPLTLLKLRETPVTDLSPLRSAGLRDALREIYLWKTKVADFSPIAGCLNLEVFDASDTALADLSIVKGMKLHTLMLARTAVADLTPVAGMPLETINITGTKVTDLSPLLQCPTLKSLVLPQDAADVQSLRALPKLARLSYTSVQGGDPDKTAAEFWAEYDRTISAAAP